MRFLRLTIPAILFAVILVGCIVQADTYSDQNPFSAPDTLQSSNNSTLPTATAEPAPIATPKPPTATPEPTPNAPRTKGIPTW
ncbi:MAG: hypothetical protein OXI80_18910 [Caldilineaceae bacterium]|nr:hypothetical protein [Caldilineaceae bacterium]MDE0339751.1 hypothetical protein [Caldilineaceae bacterium]